MQPLTSIATQAGHQRVTVAVLFAAYLAGFGVFLPFFPVWLDSQGLDAGWIAVLVAVPLIVRVLTTSLVTDYAERFADPRRPLLLLSILTLFVFAVLPMAELLSTGNVWLNRPWAILVVIALMAVGWNALLPLSDALGIQVARVTRTDYGKMRVWGSVAFIAVSFAAGAIVEIYGAKSIPWMVVVLFFLMVLACVSLPSSMVNAKAEKSGGKAQKTRSGWVFFLRRKGAVSVFIGAGLIMSSHAVLYGFGSLSWANQGFSETTIGLLWSFSVFCEVVLFAISGPIIAKIGARGLLILAGLGAAFRWAVFAFAPDLPITIALQVLHAFSFGMTHLAVIAYISRRGRARELRGAQGVYGVVSGALMAVATLAAGPLFSALGPMAYMAMAGTAGVGVLIIFVNRLRVPGGVKPQPVC